MDDSSDHEDSRAATPERPNGEERWRALFADLFDQFDQKTAAVARLEAEKRELEEKLKKAEESRLVECTSCKNKPPAPQPPKDARKAAEGPFNFTVYQDGHNYNMFCSPSGPPAGGLTQPAVVGTSNDAKKTPVVEQPKTAGNAGAAPQAGGQWPYLGQAVHNFGAYFHPMGTGTPAVFAPLNGNQNPAVEKPKSPQKAAVAPARPSTVSVQLKPAVQPPTAAASDDEPIGLYEQMRRLKADVQRLKEQREEDVETLKLAFAAEVAELRSELVAERWTRAWLEDEVRRLAVAARPKEPQKAATQANEQPEAGPSGLLAAQPPADEDDRASVATARSFHSADSSADSWDKLEGGDSHDDDELD
ncbi:hypothetical protein M3Y99_00820900 [Aphelenchoides fujianensis]|nr:hypothetical protein M3Y99_00820900 [Aphelenchoides fujianensis]